jgi:hypothetical protein
MNSTTPNPPAPSGPTAANEAVASHNLLADKVGGVEPPQPGVGPPVWDEPGADSALLQRTAADLARNRHKLLKLP